MTAKKVWLNFTLFFVHFGGISLSNCFVAMNYEDGFIPP